MTLCRGEEGRHPSEINKSECDEQKRSSVIFMRKLIRVAPENGDD